MPELGRPIASAIALVVHNRQVLLVQRRNPPDAGLWGYPGGKIEPGETIMQAALRELREETGIVGLGRHALTPLEVVRQDIDGGLVAHFILLPVVCQWIGGVAHAASDALDVSWLTLDHLEQRKSLLCDHVLELAQQVLALETVAAT